MSYPPKYREGTIEYRKVYAGRNPSDIQSVDLHHKVATYQAEISTYPVENIAYVDECGNDTYLYREYGYAASGRKYKRCGVVAAQLNGKILAPLQYDGMMDSSLGASQILCNLAK